MPDSQIDGVAKNNSGLAGLRICLLTTQNLDMDPFPADDWPCDPRPFLPEAQWNYVAMKKKASAADTVAGLVGSGKYDVFFNLCDGADGEDKPGIEVVETLERLRAPFTGATSNYYEPTRECMKEVCRQHGIATPLSVLARNEDDVERAAETLNFPLFVKHHNSYASVALSRASRVQSPAGLRRQARKFISRYGASLIEEYIAGVECTVLVAENPDDADQPITYVPLQYRFPEGESFKHEKIKWVDFDGLQTFPVEDEALADRLRSESARFFRGLDGAGFGRCDIRLSEDGTPHMLEINPNCGVYYPPSAPGSADLCLLQDPAGHEGFTRLLVRAALARHK